MDDVFVRSKIFWAIIIGAIIIGGFVYAGLKNNSQNYDISLTPELLSEQKIPQNTKNDLSASTIKCGAADETIVTKVIDGDTVVVEGGYHVRLLGMDADENGYPCYEPAKIRLEQLILGKQVLLEKDKTDVDQYGRCLRYIFLGNENINIQLVKEGLAVARFYPPDIKYKVEIASAEKQAQINKIGCKWSNTQQGIVK